MERVSRHEARNDLTTFAGQADPGPNEAAAQVGRMPTGSRKLVAGADGEVRIGADPAIVTNPRVLEFHRYWLARRGGGL